MGKRKFLVIVDWIDKDVSDSDEVFVAAATASGATLLGRTLWKKTAPAGCEIERVYVMTPERRRELE